MAATSIDCFFLIIYYFFLDSMLMVMTCAAVGNLSRLFLEVDESEVSNKDKKTTEATTASSG